MSEDIAKQAILLLLKNAKNKNYTPSLYFIGGEPLLNIPLIKFCIALCRDLENQGFPKTNFSLTTNGVLLDRKLISFFKKNEVEICISLDGKKDKHDCHRKTFDGKGSYNNVINNIKLLTLENKLDKEIKKISVRATVTKQSRDTKETLEFFNKLKVPSYRIFPVSVTGNKNDNDICINHIILNELVANQIYFFKRQIINRIEVKDVVLYDCLVNILLDTKVEFPCGACRNYLGIDINGNILPCHRFFGKDEYIIGNIKEGIINKNIVDSFNTKVQDRNNCKNCDIKFLCGGPCHFDHLVTCSNTHTTDKFSCDFSKILYKSLREFAEELQSDHTYIFKEIIKKIFSELKCRGAVLDKHNEAIFVNNIKSWCRMVNLIDFTSKKYIKTAECIDLDEEGILYKEGRFDKKYIINTTAMAIWDLLDGNRTAEQITQEIADVCEVEFEAIKDDIYGQLAAFQELGLVEEVAAADHA